jgi:hypothetical protein
MEEKWIFVEEENAFAFAAIDTGVGARAGEHSDYQTTVAEIVAEHRGMRFLCGGSREEWSIPVIDMPLCSSTVSEPQSDVAAS